MISKKQISIEQACSDLEISRSSLYKWKQNPEHIDNDIYLRKEIQGICLEFQFYGYRRITHELKRRKMIVNSKRVRKIMKEDNLICLKEKSMN